MPDSNLDTRRYFAEGYSVFQRQGSAPVVKRELAHCVSNGLAKLIANSLNLYHRNSRFAASVDAAEKREHTNGNDSD